MNSAGESLGTYGAIIVGDITSPPLFPLRTSIAALSNVVIGELPSCVGGNQLTVTNDFPFSTSMGAPV